MFSRITERNLPEKVLDYADKHYALATFEAIVNCPYDLEKYGDDYADMQSLVWATHAWVNPKTGQTILEEYADKHVKDKKMAARIAKVRNIVFDEFEVVDDNDDDFIVSVRDSKGAAYRFKTKHIYKLMFIKAGRIAAAIHPWYDNGIYKAAGSIKPIN